MDYSVISVGFLMGAALIIVPVIQITMRHNQKKHWIRTMGTVINMNDNEGYVYEGTTHSPVIKYFDKDGAMHTVEGVPNEGYNIGDEVTLIYNPNDPKQVVPNDIFYFLLAPAFSIAMGLIILFYACNYAFNLHIF